MKKRLYLSLMVALFLMVGSLPAKAKEGIGSLQWNYGMKAFLNGDGEQMILLWDKKTGRSEIYYYYVRQWYRSKYQLPQKHLQGVKPGNYEMCTYLDGEKYLYVLIYDRETGQSVIYYYYVRRWIKSKYQLPQKPLEEIAAGSFKVLSVLDSDKYLNVMFFDQNTGRSVLYYYYVRGWKKFKYQMAQNPLQGVTAGNFGAQLFMDRENYVHFLAYDRNTGQSAFYYYHVRGWIKSKYQLTQKPLQGVTAGNFEIKTFVDTEKYTNVVIYDKFTGQSALYYYHVRGWVKSKYQLTQKPLGEVNGASIHMSPFVVEKGYTNILVWDQKSGKTKLFYYYVRSWEPWKYQLPQ